MSLNLMLHCGAARCDRGAIDHVQTPPPTRTWTPLPHGQLIDQARSTLTSAGLTVVNEAHALWHRGDRYFGLFELAGSDGAQLADYSLVAGLRNSHDKSFPASFCVGAGVFVCDNLSFSSEITLSRKHTRHIHRDLPQIMSRGVGQLADHRQLQDQRIKCYKSTKLDDRTAHDLIIRAIDARCLPPTQLPALLREYRDPSHDEFTEGGMTGWRLFNAFTEVLKNRTLVELPKRTQSLHGLLDLACEVRTAV